jgi:hypothetical protein
LTQHKGIDLPNVKGIIADRNRLAYQFALREELILVVGPKCAKLT